MADILIKNMEIPKDYKYVDVRIFRDGTATTSSAEEPFYKKMDVVEVPPHGRLIDVNALDDAFTNLRWTTGDYKTGELAHWGDRKDWCLKGQEVDALIKSAPTIIEEDGT